MCGILGAVSSKKIDINAFDEALKTIKHRGPDFDRSELLSDNVAFGHVRLSILDLSAENHQPFSVDNRYTLTYNGEIFNFIELRDELKLQGIKFITDGDTEVVLRSYIYWGESCVNKFNGMWAFAIYDKIDQKLFCSRDRFGIKPFSYYKSNDEFLFASEIKGLIAFRPEIKVPNYNMIANFCFKSLGAQAEETWFRGVKRLQSAHNLVYQKGKLRIYKYWDYPKKVNKQIDFATATTEFERIFKDAIKIRMRSDVKVGSTLSSGLDSSSIVGVINSMYEEKITTYTAYSKTSQFSKRDAMNYNSDVDLDESKIVKDLIKEFNVDSHLLDVSCSTNDFIKRLTEANYYLESGNSSPAVISIHQVYKAAAKDIKVLMEGQGADELLAGYVSSVFPYYLLELLKRGKIVKAIKAYAKFKDIYSLKHLLLLYARSFDHPFLDKIKNRSLKIDIFDLKKFKFQYVKDNIKEKNRFSQKFNEVLFKQHTSGLVNLLHYGDALSMSQGIECRLPFMDYRLVEFAFTLPYDYKFRDMQGKFIQRLALKEYLPDYILSSKIKIGFATPIDELFNSNNEIEKILLEYNYEDFFNNESISEILTLHRNGKYNYSPLLFRVLSAKIWFKIFFNKNI